jgi:hypothetical protein
MIMFVMNRTCAASSIDSMSYGTKAGYPRPPTDVVTVLYQIPAPNWQRRAGPKHRDAVPRNDAGKRGEYPGGRHRPEPGQPENRLWTWLLHNKELQSGACASGRRSSRRTHL